MDERYAEELEGKGSYEQRKGVSVRATLCDGGYQ